MRTDVLQHCVISVGLSVFKTRISFCVSHVLALTFTRSPFEGYKVVLLYVCCYLKLCRSTRTDILQHCVISVGLSVFKTRSFFCVSHVLALTCSRSNVRDIKLFCCLAVVVICIFWGYSCMFVFVILVYL